MLCAMLIIQVALASAWVALFLRDGGPKTPCKWPYRGGIYSILGKKRSPPSSEDERVLFAVNNTLAYCNQPWIN